MLHPPKVQITPNQSLQDYYTLPKNKCLKQLCSRPPHPRKMKVIQYQSYKDTILSQSARKNTLLKTLISSQSRNYPELVLLGCYTLPKSKLSKISLYKTTTAYQSTICPESFWSRPPYLSKKKNYPKSVLLECYTIPKCKLSKISLYNTTTCYQRTNCPKLLCSRHHIL